MEKSLKEGEIEVQCSRKVCGKVFPINIIENESNRFIMCPKCKASSANHYYIGLKGGNNMAKKKIEVKEITKPIKLESEVKEKKVSLSAQIRDLLGKNIPIEKIMEQLNCPRKSILDCRWVMNHPKK